MRNGRFRPCGGCMGKGVPNMDFPGESRGPWRRLSCGGMGPGSPPPRGQVSPGKGGYDVAVGEPIGASPGAGLRGVGGGEFAVEHGQSGGAISASV